MKGRLDQPIGHSDIRITVNQTPNHISSHAQNAHISRLPSNSMESMPLIMPQATSVTSLALYTCPSPQSANMAPVVSVESATTGALSSAFSRGLLVGLLALPILHSYLASANSNASSQRSHSSLQHSNSTSAINHTSSTHLSPQSLLFQPSFITSSAATSLLVVLLAVVAWLLGSLYLYFTRPLIKHCRLNDSDVSASNQPGRYTTDLLPAFPNSWFLLCDDLELSALPCPQSLTVRALGHTFSLSRQTDGAIHCVDEQQRLWETAECNRAIFVWHDSAGRSSAWQLPDIDCDLSDCQLLGRISHEVSCQMIEIPENGADTAHLPTLHGPFVLPGLPFLRHTWDVTWEAQLAPQQHVALLSISSTVALFSHPLPFTRTTTPIIQAGPSLVLLLLDTPFGPLAMIESVTPITANLQRLTNTLWLPRHVPRVYGRLMMSGVVDQLERDLSVWNRKRWLRRPLVVREDGPILKYRRWMRQFFDGNELQQRRDTTRATEQEEYVTH